ncbi:MAG: methyltransferase domain-containing protein [Candidatus Omnitrophica bacterium]|nr:methyltransferase domain-containing protein [Candidatus Omnitrophota bacterium]
MEHPAFYDSVQKLVGSKIIYKNLAEMAKSQTKSKIIIDLGGGTGIYQNIWEDVKLYMCLDNDIQKLIGFTHKSIVHGIPLLADATNIPLKNQSVDIIQCTMMSHHLTENQLIMLISESSRVLKDTGIFFFADAIWLPQSWKGRFLWSMDRGSYPKSQEMLMSMIQKEFIIFTQKTLQIHHTYLLCTGKKTKINL